MASKTPLPLTLDMAQKVAEDLVEGRMVGAKTMRHFAASYVELLDLFKSHVKTQATLERVRGCAICSGSGVVPDPTASSCSLMCDCVYSPPRD